MTHNKGGRPSRGDRTLTVVRIPTSVADLVRVNAQASGLSVLAYMWAILVETLDEPWFAPAEIHDDNGEPRPLREILLSSGATVNIEPQWSIQTRDEDPLIRMSLNIPTPLSVAMRAAAGARGQTPGQYLTAVLCDWHGITAQPQWSQTSADTSARKEPMST